MSSSDISRDLGQLLMSGYTMLADACPTCNIPLMKPPGNAAIPICVGCGGSSTAPSTQQQLPASNGYHNEETHDTIPSPDEELLIPPPSLRQRLNDTPNTANDSNDPSQEIADRMLEGWTLLAEHCPICITPFIRNKEGEIYCCKCQMFARIVDGEQQSAVSTGIAAPNPRVQDADRGSRPSGQQQQQQQQQRPMTSVNSALQAVAKKLDLMTAELDKSSLSDCKQQLMDIRECAETMDSLAKLRNKLVRYGGLQQAQRRQTGN